jgi:ankyrin repeat protein
MYKFHYFALLFILILSEASVYPMHKGHEQALLYNAIKHGSPREVQNALDAGADVNMLDANGLAPIHYATQRHTPNILSLLLKAHAQVNIQSKQTKQTLFIWQLKWVTWKQLKYFFKLEQAHIQRILSNKQLYIMLEDWAFQK